MDVLKTTSPMVSPCAPNALPSKTVPSANTSNALPWGRINYPPDYCDYRHPLQRPIVERGVLSHRCKGICIYRPFPFAVYYCDIRIRTRQQSAFVNAEYPCRIERHLG